MTLDHVSAEPNFNYDCPPSKLRVSTALGESSMLGPQPWPISLEECEGYSLPQSSLSLSRPASDLENERPSAARSTVHVITWATLTANGKQTCGFKCYYSYLDELATDMSATKSHDLHSSEMRILQTRRSAHFPSEVEQMHTSFLLHASWQSAEKFQTTETLVAGFVSGKL